MVSIHGYISGTSDISRRRCHRRRVSSSSLPKTNVRTSIVNKGRISDQLTPTTVCLYRTSRSRQVKNKNSSLKRQRSRQYCCSTRSALMTSSDIINSHVLSFFEFHAVHDRVSEIVPSSFIACAKYEDGPSGRTQRSSQTPLYPDPPPRGDW